MLTIIQFCAGGFIEGSITIIGLVSMDCVIPELSGSSHAMASFLAQCTLKFIIYFYKLTLVFCLQLVHSLLVSPLAI